MEKHAAAKRASRSKLSVSTARPSPSPQAAATAGAHRIRICYQDEAFRARSQQNAKRLVISATSPSSASSSSLEGNAALVAKKALKYRKVLERIGDRDVTDPAFDVWELLRVDWCKQPSLKPYALLRQH